MVLLSLGGYLLPLLFEQGSRLDDRICEAVVVARESGGRDLCLDVSPEVKAQFESPVDDNPVASTFAFLVPPSDGLDRDFPLAIEEQDVAAGGDPRDLPVPVRGEHVLLRVQDQEDLVSGVRRHP